MLCSNLKFNKTLKMATFVAVVVGLALSIPAQAYRMIQAPGSPVVIDGAFTSARPVSCRDRGGFAHWEDHSQGWGMNPIPGSSVNQLLLGRLSNALASWTAVTGSDYFLFPTGFGSNSGTFAIDGSNSVTWATNFCNGNCISLTGLVLAPGQVIIESDIILRTDLPWSIDGSTVLDVEAEFAHSLGHSLGIHHSNVDGFDPPTMTSAVIGMPGRTLEDDDEEALRCSITRYGRDRPGTTIKYRAHVAKYGWLQWVQDGATAGTTGESRRMEAAEIQIINGPSEMGVCYQAHVAGDGWLGSVCNGATAGTTGESRRMEAIRIWLTNFPQGCDVEYRAHVAGDGWLEWVNHSEVAGTTGESRRMEALEVRLIGTCN